MSIANNFKDNLTFSLTYRNINHTDLAKLIGTTRRIVSNWLNTEANIPLEMIVEISKELNISIETLIFGDKKDVEAKLSGYELDSQTDNVQGKLGSYSTKDNVDGVYIDDTFVHEPTALAKLVRILSKNHKELINDPIYQLYVGRIITEYKTEEIKREAREEVSKSGSSTYTKS